MLCVAQYADTGNGGYVAGFAELDLLDRHVEAIAGRDAADEDRAGGRIAGPGVTLAQVLVYVQIALELAIVGIAGLDDYAVAGFEGDGRRMFGRERVDYLVAGKSGRPRHGNLSMDAHLSLTGGNGVV